MRAPLGASGPRLGVVRRLAGRIRRRMGQLRRRPRRRSGASAGTTRPSRPTRSIRPSGSSPVDGDEVIGFCLCELSTAETGTVGRVAEIGVVAGPSRHRPRRGAPRPRLPRAPAARCRQDRPRRRRRERDDRDPALHLGGHDPAAGVHGLGEDRRGGTVTRHGSSQQGDAVQRARRRPGARARVRQSWLSSRCGWADRAPLRGEALDLGCRLEFKGWKRTRLLQPGRFTELFFLDEATAFAAGHRPCALCRYEDYRELCDALAQASSGRRGGGGRDRRPVARRAGGSGNAWTAPPRGAVRGAPGRGVRRRRGRRDSSCSGSGCCGGRPAG